MVQEIWRKFNANERLAAIGAIVIIISWIVGAAGAFGIGSGTLPLVGAIAVLVIYYLKYAPNQNINWPTPVPLIVLGISGVVALIALLGALSILGALGALSSFLGLYTLAIIGTAVGAVIMVWGAWQEYQAVPKTTTAAPPVDNTPPPPPSTNPQA